MERHQKSESSDSSHSSNHQIERRWNIQCLHTFGTFPCTSLVQSIFTLFCRTSPCAPPPHSSSNTETFTSAAPQPQTVVQKLEEFPRLCSFSSISFIRLSTVSVCPGSPSSKLWTGRDLLFYPQRNSRGDRFQRCTINY